MENENNYLHTENVRTLSPFVSANVASCDIPSRIVSTPPPELDFFSNPSQAAQTMTNSRQGVFATPTELLLFVLARQNAEWAYCDDNTVTRATMSQIAVMLNGGKSPMISSSGEKVEKNKTEGEKDKAKGKSANKISGSKSGKGSVANAPGPNLGGKQSFTFFNINSASSQLSHTPYLLFYTRVDLPPEEYLNHFCNVKMGK
jgi:hypothetical protein